jgi:hypothetical protein
MCTYVHILWNTMVHYSAQRSPPPASVPSDINPVNAIATYVCKIHFNIYLRLCFLVVSFFLSFPRKSQMQLFSLHSCYTRCQCKLP